MHSFVAMTLPEMGQGLLGIVALGATLAGALAVLVMAHSALCLWHTWRATRAARDRPRPQQRIASRVARAPAQ